MRVPLVLPNQVWHDSLITQITNNKQQTFVCAKKEPYATKGARTVDFEYKTVMEEGYKYRIILIEIVSGFMKVRAH